MIDNKKTWWEKWKEVVTIAIVAFLVGLLYVIVLFSEIDLSDSSIVLGFFGILTTFVVIGNYAQVITIKSEIKEEIADIKDESKDNSLVSKINGLYGANGRPKYENDIQEKVFESVTQQMIDYNSDLVIIFDFLLKNQHLDFLSKVLDGEEVKCTVVAEEGNNPQTARAKLEGERIVFRDSHRNSMEHIFTVDKKKYDKEAFDRIAQWWHRNNMPNMPSPETQNLLFGQRVNAEQ